MRTGCLFSPKRLARPLPPPRIPRAPLRPPRRGLPARPPRQGYRGRPCDPLGLPPLPQGVFVWPDRSLQDPAGVKGDDLLPRHAEPSGIDLVVVGSRLAADRPDPGRSPAHFPRGSGEQEAPVHRPGDPGETPATPTGLLVG